MKFDKDEIKRAASGRWVDVLESAGINRGFLDGQHHPCPKCSTNATDDRFRFIDAKDGAVFCNQCFDKKNGDGFAAIQWFLGITFPESLDLVANFFNIKSVASGPARVAKADPAKDLKFTDWNDSLVALWCITKPPIKPEALKATGARIATYRGKWTVIAIPVRNSQAIVGWCLYNITGGDLMKWNKSAGESQPVKVKLTYGSKAGIIGEVEPGSSIVMKTEGPTDYLAAMSIQRPEGVSIFCNANGAKENPIKFKWLNRQLAGATIWMVGDCDQPGQEGILGTDDRPGFATYFSSVVEGATVKNLVLPYPIEKTKGKDLRDWLNEGNGWDQLQKIYSSSVAIESSEEFKPPTPDEHLDDPARLARLNLGNYWVNHRRKMAYWSDTWYSWKEGCYFEMGPSHFKARLTAATKEEFDKLWEQESEDYDEWRQSPDYEAKKDKGPPKVRKVSTALVNNVEMLTRSMAVIQKTTKLNTWLPTGERRNLLSMSNGLLDLDALMSNESDLGQILTTHSPDWFSLVKLDYGFDLIAECPRWEKFLEFAMDGDEDRISILQEWAGYLLTQDNRYQKFLALEGDGQNGKSVYLAGMKAMLGVESISAVPLENFSGFNLAQTLGKKANIAADVGEIDKLAEGILKQFCGGDSMFFDRKNKSGLTAAPTAKMMCAWNHRPRVKDRSRGLWRRMILVPFLTEVPESRRVHGMDSESWWIDHGEAPGILNWAIRGLARLSQWKKFTGSKAVNKAEQDYEIDSNPAAQFLREHVVEDDTNTIACVHIYAIYSKWCETIGRFPLSDRQFTKEVKREFKFIKKRHRRSTGDRPYEYRGIRFNAVEIAGIATSEIGF